MSEELYEESLSSTSASTSMTPVKKKKSKKRKHDQIEQNSQQNDEIEQQNLENFDANDDYIDESEIEPNDNSKTHKNVQVPSYLLDQYSCVEHIHRQIKFPVLPIATNQELKVIRQTLIHKWKYRYINELNGFLYYFDNVEFIESNGLIMDDLPFIYYYITGDFYVFRPKVGNYLKTKISCFEDSNKMINCSTDCELTISIPLPEEISDKMHKYLKLHQEIIFLIQNIDYSKMIIEGTINKRCLKLMEKHVEIIAQNEDIEQNNQNESNLDDFFAN